MELQWVEGVDYSIATHWVACTSFDRHVNGDLESPGECDVVPKWDAAVFRAYYLSLDQRVVETVADGDCGLDVMCMMLGRSRNRLHRDQFREELAAWALRHVGNRALVYVFDTFQEITGHLGAFELEAVAALLFAPQPDPGEREHHVNSWQPDPGESEHHVDGGAVVAVRHADGGLSQEKPAHTPEMVRAITWKCNLQQSSPEFVGTLLRKLSDATVPS